MRSRNSLMRERREAFRDARLIVIASEGKDTERIYFKALAKEYSNPRVHVHILERSVDEQNNSSPEHVLKQLNDYKSQYELEADDELWLVVDKDRWTEAKNDMPLYDVTFPYIRMMAGQVDFTPGAMRNGTRDNWKAIYTKPISMGTRCHQAACYIVQDSPFTMLADTPTNYEADEPYTRYIASLPVVFDKTIVPQGEIGKYIVTARKKGNNWYVGGQSNWDERTLTLKFDFLPNGDYEAIVLKDGINANHDAEDYKIEKSVINQNQTGKLKIKQNTSGQGKSRTKAPPRAGGRKYRT